MAEDDRVTIRQARAGDVAALVALIKFHADQGKMIERTPVELFAMLREFEVAVEPLPGHGEDIVGCVAAHIFAADLAELKCVAVRADRQRRGIGAALCHAAHAELHRLGIRRAFTLTGSTAFFERIGYRKVSKESLPRLIWGECVRCPSFPVCREEALVLDLT